MLAVLVVLLAALGLGASAASADGVRFGINDDAGMFERGAGPFFPNLTSLGMFDNTMTVRWDDTQPSGFEELGNGLTLQNFLPQAVAAADLAGVTVTFDVYPRHSSAAADPWTNASRFAEWVANLARTYPTVTHFVVMNECNQPLFVNPQYSAKGRLLSAADCGAFLGAAYTALKKVNPDIFVWGLGLSPHGAAVDGRVHRDSSPFDFLAALGRWYRTSPYAGSPIMDGLDLHPYPIPQSVPFAQGNSLAGGPSYGVATLGSVYQAFFDAFNGTGQPTVGPGGLPVSLNEVGIQTVPQGAGYTGAETAGVGDRRHDRDLGLPGRLVSEADRRVPVRRVDHERQHLQADRPERPVGMAKRPLRARLGAEALGRRGRARNRRGADMPDRAAGVVDTGGEHGGARRRDHRPAGPPGLPERLRLEPEGVRGGQLPGDLDTDLTDRTGVR